MKDKLVTKGNLERAVGWIDTALQAVQEAKQDTLVSGTNIKTVNGQSLLGSGNIAIEGGSGTSLPDTANNAGKVLAVNSSANGVEWVEQSGDEPLVCHISTGSDGNGGYTYSCDKTVSEIYAAAVNGKRVFASQGGLFVPLVSIPNTNIVIFAIEVLGAAVTYAGRIENGQDVWEGTVEQNFYIPDPINPYEDQTPYIGKFLAKTSSGYEWRDASGGGSATSSIANLFEVSLPDYIFINGATDVQKYLNDNYSSPLLLYQAASLKPLSFVCGSYQWGDLQSDGIYYAEVPVHVVFPDNSELTKTVLFGRSDEYLGVKLSSAASYIDTGLTLDYSYEFEARGNTQSNSQAVLIDCFGSLNVRTTLRILGSLNKVQFMWPNNNEYTYSSTGIDFTKPFTYIQKYNSLILTQGQTTDREIITDSKSSGTGNVKILLLNSTSNSYSYGNGVLYNAIIRDSNGNVLRHFKPQYIENNELVLVDVANDNTVYRPNTGTLLPVE